MRARAVLSARTAWKNLSGWQAREKL